MPDLAEKTHEAARGTAGNPPRYLRERGGQPSLHRTERNGKKRKEKNRNEEWNFLLLAQLENLLRTKWKRISWMLL